MRQTLEEDHRIRRRAAETGGINMKSLSVVGCHATADALIEKLEDRDQKREVV